MRLAVVTSHPIQYQAPLFRALADRLDLTVFFAHRATPTDQAQAGFGVGFDWDIDLLSGYEHVFLPNMARRPGLDWFGGCDTPEVGKRLREGRFDTVLLTGWHLKCYAQALLAAKWRGIPVLVRGDSHLGTPRSSVKQVLKRVAYPPLLRLFDAALYVGARSRAYWQHYGYPERRLFFSPHCVDSAWFAARATKQAGLDLRAQLRIAPDAKVALFAGKLMGLKRPLDVVAAAARMTAEGCPVTVLVAGSGPLETAVKAAAETAGVTVHCLGFCNQSAMPAAYAAADVLVLPSTHETWGLVANEALACGMPIVVSDAVGCAPDLAADGAAGRTFRMGDVVDLARALKDVLRRPPAREAAVATTAAYSLDRAAEGVVNAAEFVIWTTHNEGR